MPLLQTDQLMKELITIKYNYSISYILFWQNVSAPCGRFQANSIKFIKGTVYTLLKDTNNIDRGRGDADG
jgi:hypothetical protein